MNLSEVKDIDTANTNVDSAIQRAENIFAMGARSVLELCVGPSLSVLEKAYRNFGISVAGNDIDQRWKRYYPSGKWVMGDALNISYGEFDSVVFAPPLSKGCTGKREDSLKIEEVFPKYTDFLKKAESKVSVLVLPARSIATREDRKQYFKLLNEISSLGFNCEAIPLTAGKRKVIKYIDLYLSR